MKIKTILRFLLSPFRITNIEKIVYNECLTSYGEKRIHSWCDCKLVPATHKSVWKILKKTKNKFVI